MIEAIFNGKGSWDTDLLRWLVLIGGALVVLLVFILSALNRIAAKLK